MIVAVYAKAEPIYKEAGVVLTARKLFRAIQVVAELSLKRQAMSIFDAIKIVFEQKFLDMNKREAVAQVMEEVKRKSVITEVVTPLRKKVREFLVQQLAKDGPINGNSFYESLAAEQGMDLDVWLGRVFKEATWEEINDLFQQLHWEQSKQIGWIYNYKVQDARPALEALLKDPDEFVRKNVADALDKLVPGWDREIVVHGKETWRMVQEEIHRPKVEGDLAKASDVNELATHLPTWSGKDSAGKPVSAKTLKELQDLIPKPERMTMVGPTVEALRGLIAGVLSNNPVYMMGTTGVGKNKLLRYLAHLTGTPLYRINFDKETDHSQLYGHFEVEIVNAGTPSPQPSPARGEGETGQPSSISTGPNQVNSRGPVNIPIAQPPSMAVGRSQGSPLQQIVASAPRFDGAQSARGGIPMQTVGTSIVPKLFSMSSQRPVFNTYYGRNHPKGRRGVDGTPEMTEREMAEAKQHANEAAEIVREEIDRFMIENGRTLENLGSLAAHRNIHVKMER